MLQKHLDINLNYKRIGRGKASAYSSMHPVYEEKNLKICKGLACI
jgi:hypothetical protein